MIKATGHTPLPTPQQIRFSAPQAPKVTSDHSKKPVTGNTHSVDTFKKDPVQTPPPHVRTDTPHGEPIEFSL